jgi:hypothetical protein
MSAGSEDQRKDFQGRDHLLFSFFSALSLSDDKCLTPFAIYITAQIAEKKKKKKKEDRRSSEVALSPSLSLSLSLYLSLSLSLSLSGRDGVRAAGSGGSRDK